jgi:hypothetical protein
VGELIIAITTGRPAFGEFACERPGRVLYVAEEGSRRKFQHRLAGLCSGYGVSLADVQGQLDVIWRRHVDLLDASWQRDLLALASHYRVIFLDPLRDMHDVDEDRVHQIKPVLDFLRRLQEQGPAVCGVMHLRKQREGDKQIRAGQRVAGTRHFHSFLDSAIYVDREQPAQDWPVKVTIEHRDEETSDPFYVELEVEGIADHPSFRLTAETSAHTLRGRHEELRARAVETAQQAGPTSKTKLATKLGIGKQAALTVVEDCLTHGLLIRSEDGREVLAPSEPVSAVPETSEPPGTAPPLVLTEAHGKAESAMDGGSGTTENQSEPKPHRFPTVPPVGGENRSEPVAGPDAATEPNSYEPGLEQGCVDDAEPTRSRNDLLRDLGIESIDDLRAEAGLPAYEPEPPKFDGGSKSS